MTHEEHALQIFDEKVNCSQSVLGAFAEELGLPLDLAMKVSQCFSAGMRKSEVCGAVSGALMVLGLKYSQSCADEAESKALSYQIANSFMDSFKNANGSYLCKEILGVDLSTDEGRSYAQDNDVFHTICPGMVVSAVKILKEIMDHPTD